MYGCGINCYSCQSMVALGGWDSATADWNNLGICFCLCCTMANQLNNRNCIARYFAA